MVEWFLWALNDVIGQLALDQEFQCLEKRRMHPWPSFLLGALKQMAALNQFRRFGISLKLLAPLMTKEMIAERENWFNQATTAVNQRLKREQDESQKLEAGNLAGDQKKQRDIVGLMLREMKGGERLTEAEVTANSILIVGGGAETTSTCLSATLYHLCKTPRVMQKLREQVRQTFDSSKDITIKACANMPYLKATIDESLRIFPVASYITPRVTPKGGHTIAGEVVPGGVSPFPFCFPRTNTLTLPPRPTYQWASGTWAAQSASSTTHKPSDPNDGWIRARKKSQECRPTRSSARSVWARGIA